MGTTKRISIPTVMRAAKKRWPNRRIDISEDRRALSDKDRENLEELRAEQKQRIEELQELLSAMPRSARGDNALCEAAQFVVDVNGDAPSIDQLREVLAERQRYRELVSEKTDLERERNESLGRLLRRRYRLTTINPKDLFGVVQADADSLSQLLAKVEEP